MCSRCDRREFLFRAIAFGTAALPSMAGAQQALPPYCGWNIGSLQKFATHSKSGNTQIDRATIAELKKILSIIPINPGFKFIDDSSPNAFATSDSVVPNTNGTVYIGLNLINTEFNNAEFGGVAVAGILAHECGHIFQFQSGYARQLAGPTGKLVELHADYIAGFYLGRDRSHSKQHVELFAKSLFSKGDYDFNNQAHHGTPQQRVSAMQSGYDMGQTNAEWTVAVQQGASRVRLL
jgi:hypothetical protein